MQNIGIQWTEQGIHTYFLHFQQLYDIIEGHISLQKYLAIV